MTNFVVKSFKMDEFLSSNVYIISSDMWSIVIDPWFYDETICIYLKALWNIDWILLTHGHWDHIRCVDVIKQDFPNTKVYVHKDDKELLSNANLNCSPLIWNKDIKVNSEVIEIEEWYMQIWWYKIYVYHFPWHTDWWVMYYFTEQKIMFMWDVIMPDTIWTIRIPTWNAVKMQQSIQKFKNLEIGLDTICYSGHSDPMIFKDILNNNPFLK